MAPKLSEVLHVLQIYANLSKKFKSMEAISLYLSESPHYALSKIRIFYKGQSIKILRNKI